MIGLVKYQQSHWQLVSLREPVSELAICHSGRWASLASKTWPQTRPNHLAGIRTPARSYLFCLDSGKQRHPQKATSQKEELILGKIKGSRNRNGRGAQSLRVGCMDLNTPSQT